MMQVFQKYCVLQIIQGMMWLSKSEDRLGFTVSAEVRQLLFVLKTVHLYTRTPDEMGC